VTGCVREKMAQNIGQSTFCKKINAYLLPCKKCAKFELLLWLKKLSQVNKRLIGEKSPNLVTLLENNNKMHRTSSTWNGRGVSCLLNAIVARSLVKKTCRSCQRFLISFLGPSWYVLIELPELSQGAIKRSKQIF
jgi:hypothetical protein